MSKEIAIKNYNLEKMSEVNSMAKALKDYVVKNELFTTISGKNYTHVDAWQVSGGMLGLFSKVVSIKDLSKGNEIKWMAEVEIVNKEDKIISRGFALCSNVEGKKKSFDEYSILSMAQTRAIGKAYRNTIGYVMKLAGYESTPSEEMTKVGDVPLKSQPIVTSSDKPIVSAVLKKGQVIGHNGKPTYLCAKCDDPIGDRGAELSMKIHGKRLCKEHFDEANKKK